MKTMNPTKVLGRPRKFDKEIALNNALDVFRRKGFEATSMTDITQAMGINRPSVYAAFGNKEALFALALERYVAGPIAYLKDVLEEKTSREVVRQMLMKSADLLTCLEKPTGCLVINSSISSELEAAGIQEQIVMALHQNERKLQGRFEQAIAEGDLPPETDANLLAKYITTIHKGMSIQASHGSNKEELIGVINVVLASWPGKL